MDNVTCCTQQVMRFKKIAPLMFTRSNINEPNLHNNVHYLSFILNESRCVKGQFLSTTIHKCKYIIKLYAERVSPVGTLIEDIRTIVICTLDPKTLPDLEVNYGTRRGTLDAITVKHE